MAFEDPAIYPVALDEKEDLYPVALADEEPADLYPVALADEEEEPEIDQRPRLRSEAFKMLKDVNRLSPRVMQTVADEDRTAVGGVMQTIGAIPGSVGEALGRVTEDVLGGPSRWFGEKPETQVLNEMFGGERLDAKSSTDVKEFRARVKDERTAKTLDNFVKFFEGNGITDGKEMMTLLKDSIRENTWDPTTDDKARVLSDGSLRINPKFVAMPDAQAGIDAIMSSPADDATREREVGNFKAARKKFAGLMDAKTKGYEEDYRTYAAEQAAKGVTDPEQVFFNWPGLDRNWIESTWDPIRDTVAEAGRGTMQTVRGMAMGLAEATGDTADVERIGRDMLASSAKSQFVSEISAARGQDGAVLGTTKELGTTVLEMVPMFVGGAGGRLIAGGLEAGAARRILGSITAGTSVYGYTYMQGYGSVMQQALSTAQREATQQGRELTGEEINSTVEKFQGAALANGFQMVLLAKLLNQGVEAVALRGFSSQAGQLTGRDVFAAARKNYGENGIRAALMATKPELVAFAKQAYTAGKVGFKDEALEEGVTQFIEGTIVKLSGADPDKTWDQIGQETWKGTWMGGVVGSGLPVAMKALSSPYKELAYDGEGMPAGGGTSDADWFAAERSRMDAEDLAESISRQLSSGAQFAAPAAAEASAELIAAPGGRIPRTLGTGQSVGTPLGERLRLTRPSARGTVPLEGAIPSDVVTDVNGVPASETAAAEPIAAPGGRVPRTLGTGQSVGTPLGERLRAGRVKPLDSPTDATPPIGSEPAVGELSTESDVGVARKLADFKVSESPDNVPEVAAANDLTVSSDDVEVPLSEVKGGVDLTQPKERARVDKLKEQILSDEGYVARVIVDADNNVIEGQHRLEALRELGFDKVPATRLKGADDFIPNESSLDSVLTENGVKSRDQRKQIRQIIAELIADEKGDVNALLDYDPPTKALEPAWNAAVAEVIRQNKPVNETTQTSPEPAAPPAAPAPETDAPAAPVPDAVTPQAATPAAKTPLTYKKAKDFGETRNYDVETAEGIRQMFRDPENGYWHDVSKIGSQFGYFDSVLGYNRQDALEAMEARYGRPEPKAAEVVPPRDTRDATYEKLLSKGKPAGPNMVELTDKQVTPAIRSKLLATEQDSARGITRGQIQETASFYLRPKADVTGVPTDRGWILKDKRPDFTARNTPPAPASTPKTEAPKAEAAPDVDATTGIEILPSERYKEADIRLGISQGRNYYTLWFETKDKRGTHYLTILSKDLDEAKTKAAEYARQIASGQKLPVAFAGRGLTGAGSAKSVAVREGLLDPAKMEEVDRTPIADQPVGTPKHPTTLVRDLMTVDPSYAEWVIKNGSSERLGKIAAYLKSRPEWMEMQDERELESERVKAYEQRREARAAGEKVSVTTMVRKDGEIVEVDEDTAPPAKTKKLKSRKAKDQILDIVAPQETPNLVAEELTKHLYPMQLVGANAAIASMEKDGVFLNGDGAGVGKTRQIVAVAHHYAKQGKRVFIISENAAIGKPWEKVSKRTGPKLAGSMSKDSEAMGIKLELLGEVEQQDGGIYVTNYSRVKAGDIPDGAVLIFDEAQNLANTFGSNPDPKNTTEREWEAKFKQMLPRASAVAYYSATPADKPHQLAYLHKTLGYATPEEYLAAARENGMVLKTRKFGKTEVQYYDVPQGAKRKKLFDWVNSTMIKAGAEGRFIKREISYEGTDVQFQDVSGTDAGKNPWAKYFNDVLDQMKAVENSGTGIRIMAPESYVLYAAELTKIGKAVEMAEREIAAGRKAVVFFSRIKPMEMRYRRYTRGVDGEMQASEPIVFGSIPSPVDLIRAELEKKGITFTELHGATKTTSQQAQKQFAENVDVLLASLESGGTGINLDDTTGSNPRTEIFMFAPYRGTSTIQGMGRIWRASTLQDDNNPNRFAMIVASDIKPDVFRSAVLAKKLQLMGAAMGGTAVAKMPMSKTSYDPKQLAGLEMSEDGEESALTKPRTGKLKPVTVQWSPTKAGEYYSKASADLLEWEERGGPERTGLEIRVFKSRDTGDWIALADRPYTAEEFALPEEAKAAPAAPAPAPAPEPEPTPPPATMEEMVEEARKWRGAAFAADKRYAEIGAKPIHRLEHSDITQKGDLDAYLMRKFGIDSYVARQVSNTLTAENLAPIPTPISQFADEPFAKLLAKYEANPVTPAPKPAVPAVPAAPDRVFNDDYTGPRWTYGLRNRPAGMGTVPKGFIIGSDGPAVGRARHGTLQYPRELTKDEIYDFELEVMEPAVPAAPAPKPAPRKSQAERPKQYSIAALAETLDLSPPQAVAWDSLLRVIGYDASQTNLKSGGIPGDGSLEQIGTRDEKYLELAKDPEKNRKQLQKLVDAAAKKAGYRVDRPVYHGTASEFDVFRPSATGRYGENIYTTTDEQSAWDYANTRAATRGGTPRVIKLYADKYAWASGDIVISGRSAAFKSAEPVTYDADGNVIPLSKRFDQENKSILYQAAFTDVQADLAEWLEEESGTVEEFVERMDTGDLEELFPNSYSDYFGDARKFSGVVYHYTTEENISGILAKGLLPQDRSRGISNRNTGSAIFTTAEPLSDSSYGGYEVAINVGAARIANPELYTDLEDPIVESNLKKMLASKLGGDPDYFEMSSSDGITEDTLVIHDSIPLDFIQVTDPQGEVIHTGARFSDTPSPSILYQEGDINEDQFEDDDSYSPTDNDADPGAIPLEMRVDEDGNPILNPQGKPRVRTIGYDLLTAPMVTTFQGSPEDTTKPDTTKLHYTVTGPSRERLSAAIDSGAVDLVVGRLVEETQRMLRNPAVAAGKGWYSRMRVKLLAAFGPEDARMFSHLLGTTSAKTPVENNFVYAVDLMRRFKRGEFDRNIRLYQEMVKLDRSGKLGDVMATRGILSKADQAKVSKGKLRKTLRSMWVDHYDILPVQTNGRLFGSNSLPALKAMSEMWLLGKVTPKTPQFAMNLNGDSVQATIDVWAARLLRRILYAKQGQSWRIQPKAEEAVSNEDFLFAQEVFRRAAEKLGMNPDDLQAIVWFGEKQIWDESGWTAEVGAFKSSFDEVFDVFFPEGRAPRDYETGRRIVSFLQAERLYLADKATESEFEKQAETAKTPEEIKAVKKQATTRRKHELQYRVRKDARGVPAYLADRRRKALSESRAGRPEGAPATDERGRGGGANREANPRPAGRGSVSEGTGPAAAGDAQALNTNILFQDAGAAPKGRTPRNPIVQQAAIDFKEGRISREDYNLVVDINMPLRSFGKALTPATREEVLRGLGNRTARKGVLKSELAMKPEDIPDGKPLAARLDIPAYEDENVWVVSLHLPGKTGDIYGYTPTSVLTDVTFNVNEIAARGVATGKAKSSFARMDGTYVSMSADEAQRLAEKALAEGWVEIGMNPIRHSYFYDKAQQRPVKFAEQVVQVGALVLAKNPVYGDSQDFLFQETSSTKWDREKFDSLPDQSKKNLAINIVEYGWNPVEFGMTDADVQTWAAEGLAKRAARLAEETAAEARSRAVLEKSKTAPPEASLVTEADLQESQLEDDGYFYHVTTPAGAKAILKSRSISFGKRQSMDEGYYAEYSRGKVFFTDRGGVSYWQGKISDHLEAQGRSGKTVTIRIPKHAVGDLKVDEPGTRDARTPAWFSPENVLFQNQRPQTAKGSFEYFKETGDILIRGLSSPDFSTAAHEFGHAIRRTLLDRDVPSDRRVGISDEDISRVEDWAGATNGKWTVAAEEKFARAWERYLREGKAPVAVLQSLFDQMAEWLSAIYTTVAGSPIDVEISPEMRAVFDKLVTRNLDPDSTVELEMDEAAPPLGDQEFADRVEALEESIAESQPPSIPPVTPPTPSPGMEEDPFADHVSNMHRFIDEARARRGLPPLMKRPRVANEDVWESALRKERAHRAAGKPGTAGNVLLAELLLNPVRTLAPWETALLLHEQALREGALDASWHNLNTLPAGDPSRDDYKATMQREQEAYDTITTFIRSAGSAAGSSLQILKMVIDKREFTLARVKNEWHAAANAKSDKPVEWTAKDQAAAEEWYHKYEALKIRESELMAENEGYAALLKQLTEDVERAQAKVAAAAKVPAIKAKILSKLTPAAEAARARIAARNAAKGGPPGPDVLMQSGPAPELIEELRDYAILLAEKMVNGVFDFAKASKIIASEFGEDLSEFAEWIYSDAKRVYNETVESVSGEGAPTPQNIVDAIDVNEELTKKEVWDLARAYVIQGARGSDVLDNVHADLNEIFPDLTREQVADLFTDYGRTSTPSPEEVPKALRRVKTLERIGRQIDDIKSRRMPKVTGRTGDPLDPNDPIDKKILALEEERRSEFRALQEWMRKYNIPFPDSEHKLKTALGSVKRRMKNDIAKMDLAIATKVARAKRQRVNFENDPEYLDLKNQVTAKRVEYDAMFKTEPDRLQMMKDSASKSLDRYLAMLVSGNTAVKTKPPGPTDPELEELRSLRNTFAKQVAEARRVRPTADETAKKERDATLAAAEKTLAELERKITENDLATKARGEPRFKDDTEIKAVRDKIAAARETLKDMRKAAMPAKDPVQAKIDAVLRSLDRQIAEETKMLADGVLKKAKGQPVSTAEIDARRETLRQMRQNRRDLYEAQNPGEIEARALESAKKAAQKAIDRLGAAVASGDVAVKQKDPGYTPDAELIALNEAREALSDKVSEMRRALPATPDQLAAREKRMLAAAEATLANLDAKLAAGDLSVKTAQGANVPASVAAVREKIKNANRQLEARRRDAGVGPYSEAAMIQRQLGSLRKKLADRRRRIREDDYSKKKVPLPVSSPEIRQVTHELELLDEVYYTRRGQYMLRNAPKGRRFVQSLKTVGAGQKFLVLGGDWGVILRNALDATTLTAANDVLLGIKKLAGRADPAARSQLRRMITKGIRAAINPKFETETYQRMVTRPNSRWDQVLGTKINSPYDKANRNNEDLPVSDLIKIIPWWVWPIVAGVNIGLIYSSPLIAGIVGMSMMKGAFMLGASVIQKPLLQAVDRFQRTYVNEARVMLIDNFIDNYVGGMDVEDGRAYAHFVNVGTGRGGARKGRDGVLMQIERMMPGLNAGLLAPRYYLARILSLFAQPLWSGPMTRQTRKAIAYDYGKAKAMQGAVVALLILAFGKANDDDPEDTGVVLNPYSRDFLKIRLTPEVVIDVMGGFNQWMGFFLRRATGVVQSRETGLLEVMTPEEKSRDMMNFVGGKSNPLLRYSAESFFVGEYFGGKPVMPMTALQEATSMVIIDDMIKVHETTDPKTAAALSLLLLSGGNVKAGNWETEVAKWEPLRDLAEVRRLEREAKLNQ